MGADVPTVTTLTRLFIGLVACVCASCGTTEAPVRKPAPAERTRLPGPSQAICDPNGCGIFCLRAACGTPTETCLAKCQAVCGDGYFDDRDGPVMACVVATPTAEDACMAAKRCCTSDYTSQLCEVSNPIGPAIPPAEPTDDVRSN